MKIFSDDTFLIILSSFYHGFSAAKDAVVSGYFGALVSNISGILHGHFILLLALPGLALFGWRIKTWMPVYIFKKIFFLS